MVSICSKDIVLYFQWVCRALLTNLYVRYILLSNTNVRTFISVWLSIWLHCYFTNTERRHRVRTFPAHVCSCVSCLGRVLCVQYSAFVHNAWASYAEMMIVRIRCIKRVFGCVCVCVCVVLSGNALCERLPHRFITGLFLPLKRKWHGLGFSQRKFLNLEVNILFFFVICWNISLILLANLFCFIILRSFNLLY